MVRGRGGGHVGPSSNLTQAERLNAAFVKQFDGLSHQGSWQITVMVGGPSFGRSWHTVLQIVDAAARA